jgi:hypothetical protein
MAFCERFDAQNLAKTRAIFEFTNRIEFGIRKERYPLARRWYPCQSPNHNIIAEDSSQLQTAEAASLSLALPR